MTSAKDGIPDLGSVQSPHWPVDIGRPLKPQFSDRDPLLPKGSKKISSILDRLPYLLDSEVGIIRSLREIPIDEDDPNFFHFSSETGDTSEFSRLKNFSFNGGVATTQSAAMGKAIGEAVERYCSAIFDYKNLRYTSFDQLDGAATDPDDFALFSPEQYSGPGFSWRPFTRIAPVAWTTGTALLSSVPIFVPAAMVYAPYHYVRNMPDTPICQPISTGLACGSSYESASMAAICEVIERDAFTITWQGMLSCPLISPESLPKFISDILDRFARVGIAVRLVNITKDIPVTSIMAIGISDAKSSPGLAFAASTDPSPERAIIKSLEELAHTRKYAKLVMNTMPPIESEPEAGHPFVVDQKSHLRFYCPQEAKEYAGFAWASSNCTTFSELPRFRMVSEPEQLMEIANILAARNLYPVICDLTTPDIRQLDLHVVRAVIPGMHPLFMGYRNRALGGRRLCGVPHSLGYRGVGPSSLDNPFPHPFP